MSPTVFEDNKTIENDEKLFRRIHLLHLVPDEDTGLARVSTGAFKQKEMSINIDSTLRQEGQESEACLIGYPGQRLVSIRAGMARKYQQAICRDPLPWEISHGLVYGNKNGRIPEKLRDAASWEIPTVPPAYKEIEKQKLAARS
jgi:hypothetical protein